jgi:hypothetical protein
MNDRSNTHYCVDTQGIQPAVCDGSFATAAEARGYAIGVLARQHAVEIDRLLKEPFSAEGVLEVSTRRCVRVTRETP